MVFFNLIIVKGVQDNQLSYLEVSDNLLLHHHLPYDLDVLIMHQLESIVCLECIPIDHIIVL